MLAAAFTGGVTLELASRCIAALEVWCA